MSLLLSADALVARKAAHAGSDALGGLAGSLQRELHAALDVAVPDGKSRLTRHGGRCASCTVLLAFDPRSQSAHVCGTCGAVYTEHVHHEWWLMNAHLWTAEQCTRAAALAFLCDDTRAAIRADSILATYTDRYLRWPNRDNALGPTRPFFSTYLESIWLLHLCVALDLRERAGAVAPAAAGDIRDRLIAPSAALIVSFPEGRSNREVWHCAARLAAAGILGNAVMRDTAADSLRTLLRTGLHSDGSWYEGENYHLFAHRGLLSAVTLAERAGIELAPELMARFEAGFAAPFRTMLPDGTFPARRDSQYGVSLRQYRTADWLECGIARRDRPALRAALAMMYDDSAPVGDTGRAHSTADAERNQRGVRLTRADCSWRALLLARPDLPPLEGAVPHSELLDGQGFAVFRRNAGRFWVGLDYGDPGAGHGHPDRLNLVVATDTHRWLDDFGTGSYTAPTLAWYRSSLAHNAVLVDGTDQASASGRLLAHDEQGDIGWVSAEFIDPRSSVRFVRSVIVATTYVLDMIEWESATDVSVDLPLQLKLREDLSAGAWRADETIGAASEFLSDCTGRTVARESVIPLLCLGVQSPAVPAPRAARAVALHLWTDAPAYLWRATTIGPPAGAPHGLIALRQFGQHGRSVRLLAESDSGLELRVDGDAIAVTHADGVVTQHVRRADGWSVQGSGTSTAVVHLAGVREHVPPAIVTAPDAADIRPHVLCGAVDESGRVMTTLLVAEDGYRATEVPWRDAGRPTAAISVGTTLARADNVTVVADIRLDRAPDFAPEVHDNPLDNEHPDTNSDGVQLHWRAPVTGEWTSVLAVPIPGSDAVRLTTTSGTPVPVAASWARTDRGYVVMLTLPWSGADTPFEFDVVVNERPAGRERRQGQLVLSGANGESAYLRGARQGPERAISVLFQHPSS